MKMRANPPKFKTIHAASVGNIDAIVEIIAHYDPYISTVSSRPLYDEYGNSYIAINSELKGMIITALITALLKFKIRGKEDICYKK